ncbi:hypothetical protein [Acidisoma sp. C75]
MPRHRLMPLAAFLFAALVLGLAAGLRGPEYDEGYTAFVTGHQPRPAWPEAPFRAGAVRAAFAPAATPWAIGANLRQTDVHPPLYFWLVWAWRRAFGPDLLISRLLSVLASLAALGAVRRLAQAAALPAWPAVFLTLGCFGFVETGITARGYALAQALQLSGLLLCLRAAEAEAKAGGMRGAWRGTLAGLVLGAASFTNYLAAFPAAAAALWLLRRNARRGAALLLGLAPFVAADAWFFWAQRSSRIGQFPPFSIARFLGALAHAAGGAVLGGLPLYLPAGPLRLLLGAALALLLGAMLLLPALRWRRLGRPAPRALLGIAALATPAGLLVMGLAARSVPVELRYLAFALPPFMLLLAGALGRLPGRAGPALLALILGLQMLAIGGLMLAPATMQPEGAAARAAARAAGTTGLVLLPRGNDGVGIVSAFLTAAPPGLHILLIRPGESAARLAPLIARFPCVVAPRIAVDDASRAAQPLIRALLRRAPNCIDAR